jgi:hypothetical protein
MPGFPAQEDSNVGRAGLDEERRWDREPFPEASA